MKTTNELMAEVDGRIIDLINPFDSALAGLDVCQKIDVLVYIRDWASFTIEDILDESELIPENEDL